MSVWNWKSNNSKLLLCSSINIYRCPPLICPQSSLSSDSESVFSFYSVWFHLPYLLICLNSSSINISAIPHIFDFQISFFFLDKHQIKMRNGLIETEMPGLIAGMCVCWVKQQCWLTYLGDIKRRQTSTYGMDEFLIVVRIHNDFQHKNICLTFEEDSTKPDARVKLRWVCFSGWWWVVRLQ